MAKLAEVVICSEVLLGRRVRLGLGEEKSMHGIEAKLKTERRERTTWAPPMEREGGFLSRGEGPPTWRAATSKLDDVLNLLG